MLTTRRLVTAALMATILVVSKYALDAMPNIELVSLLIIAFALELPKLTMPAIYGYVFIYGLFNGFGIWWFPQLYIWLVLFIMVRLLHRLNSTILFAVISGFFGLLYGALYSLSYMLTNGIYSGIAWWIAGIPFDILHCVGNFVVCLVLLKPIRAVLNKCKYAINIA